MNGFRIFSKGRASKDQAMLFSPSKGPKPQQLASETKELIQNMAILQEQVLFKMHNNTNKTKPPVTFITQIACLSHRSKCPWLPGGIQLALVGYALFISGFSKL